MSTFASFFRKELTARKRTDKITALTIIFLFLGVLAPATAKFMPKLLEKFGDSMTDSGMTITVSEPTALSSFSQFFGNFSIGLIVMIVMESGVFAGEYSSGTLIPVLTKGLKRAKVYFAKLLTVILLWTVYYWISFSVMYGYTAYYWDTGVVNNGFIAGFSAYAYGLYLLILTAAFSAMASTGIQTLIAVGAVYLGDSLLAMVPKLSDWLPCRLIKVEQIINGKEQPDVLLPAFGVTAALSIAAVIISKHIFDKKPI